MQIGVVMDVRGNQFAPLSGEQVHMPHDFRVLEDALFIKEQSDVTNVTVTIWMIGERESVIFARYALALGADQAVLIVREENAAADSSDCAGSPLYTQQEIKRVCHHLLHDQECDLIITHKRYAERECAWLAYHLAGTKGIPALTSVQQTNDLKCSVATNGQKYITVSRSVRNEVEQLQVHLPALITVVGSTPPRFVPIAQMTLAMTKPLQVISMDDSGDIAGQDDHCRHNLQRMTVVDREVRGRTHSPLIQGTSAEQVEVMMRIWRDEAWFS